MRGKFRRKKEARAHRTWKPHRPTVYGSEVRECSSKGEKSWWFAAVLLLVEFVSMLAVFSILAVWFHWILGLHPWMSEKPGAGIGVAIGTAWSLLWAVTASLEATRGSSITGEQFFAFTTLPTIGYVSTMIGSGTAAFTSGYWYYALVPPAATFESCRVNE